MSEGLVHLWNKLYFDKIQSNRIKLYNLKKPSTFNLFPCSHTWFSTLYSTRVTRVRASQCCPQSLDVNLCGVLPLRLSSARFFFLRYPYNRAWVSTGGKGAWHPRNFWTVLCGTRGFWQFYCCIMKFEDLLKYSSQERNYLFYECSPLLGFIMSKKQERLRSELLSEDKITNLLVFLT